MSEEAPEVVEYLLVQLGDERYALPPGVVREVARLGPITPVPGTPPALPGIISRHGAVLPVVDLRPLLGLATAPPTRASRLVVAQQGEDALALLVDAALDLVRIPAAAFGPLPPSLDPGRGALLAGLAEHDGQPLMQLDLAALLRLLGEDR